MAQSTLFEMESVYHTPDAIRLTWRDIGGFYRVFRADELLYEGTVATFQDGYFQANQLYDYTIERVIDDCVVDVIRVQTSTYHQKEDVENPLQGLVMTTVVSCSKITLFWEAIQGVSHYAIYRNGVFLETVGNAQYVDRNLVDGESYIYHIQSNRLLAQSEESFRMSKSVIAKLLKKVSNTKHKPAIESFTMIKDIRPINQLLVPVRERTEPKKVNRWAFRYTTFLRDDVVKNPNLLSGNVLFQGDNRGFHPEGARFRTRVDISLHEQRLEMPMVCERRIGETIAYSRFGRVRDIATAGSEGITVKRTDDGKKSTHFWLVHDVKNPLVAAAPGIGYEVQATFEERGAFKLSGFHNQAPHHEVYLAQDGGEWLPIHLAESKGLVWMTDVMGSHYWCYANFI